MSAVLAIGRVLFALIFINSGIGHLTKVEAMTGYATYKKVPAPKLAVIVSGLMILIGGIYVALGVYADLGALLIAIFLIPTALLIHNFWTESDATAKMTARTGFLKDIALAGAALMIFVFIGRGADIGWHITSAFFSLK
jgi:putative oxidoreductase